MDTESGVIEIGGAGTTGENNMPKKDDKSNVVSLFDYLSETSASFAAMCSALDRLRRVPATDADIPLGEAEKTQRIAQILIGGLEQEGFKIVPIYDSDDE